MSHPPDQPLPFTPPVPAPPTSAKATTSLVLGVASLFCCGLFTGIPAIFVGVSARREVRDAGGALRGDGVAIGGIVTGVLGTLWSLVAGGILVALLVLGVQVADDYDNACDQLREGQRSDDTFLGETLGPEDCA